MSLNQENSIDRILSKFEMTECNVIDTPMEKGLQLPLEDETCNKSYREMLGSLT